MDGIPFSEADNAISSLKSSVLRICPRDAPQEYDFSEYPNDEMQSFISLSVKLA
jgi:hypothetical protein